ncbi:MAG: methyltransferase domain-containing protein [Treponema sp.]|jgi:SAM-dependent methyltransferase|nr:methyltransferase domain-containing protein [Treponema sp.]
MKPVLIVPSYKIGRGGGHLARCAALAEELRSLGREACLYAPAAGPLAVPEGGFAFIVLDCFRTSRADFPVWRRLAPVVGIDEGGPYRNYADFLIDLLPNLEKTQSNIRNPGLLRLPATRRPAWNDAPLADGVECGAGRGGRKPLRVLITFGAEDAAGLTSPAAAALAAKNGLEVTAVFGALNRSAPPHPRSQARARKDALRGKTITVLEHVPDLSERLADYDLVITHFGLTAFESLYARAPVALVSPTAYHERLARSAGFFTAGRGIKGIRRLKKLKLDGARRAALGRRCREISERYGFENADSCANGHGGNSLAHALASIAIHAADCPICGVLDTAASITSTAGTTASTPGIAGNEGNGGAPAGPAASAPGTPAGLSRKKRFSPALARFHDRTYRACPVCGITYMSRSSPPPIEYAKDYFFDLYKKQYGKTYLEDFPDLVQAGRKRLSHIVSIMKTQAARSAAREARRETERGTPRLLDIGCAYGPFLAAAREAGFDPTGIEATEDAASYVRRELGTPCFQDPFPLPDGGGPFSDGQFDVISLWYVIEHFENAGAALTAINRLLRRGGVLAFSTPSLEGVSARGSPRSLRSFLEKSPPDHYTVWSPSKTRGVLRKFGFDLKKVVITGHHPERFPVLGKLVCGKLNGGANSVRRGAAYRVLLAASRLFGLGDTFEAYAVKM